MSETRELLRPAVEGFEPMPDAFERVLDRRDRKQRNRRVAAGVVGIAIFALAAFGLARLLTSEPEPAVPEPTPPRNGNWVVFTAGRHLDPDPRAPVWSRGKHARIYVGAPDGSARPLVGDEASWQECPAFSPDGSMLAFSESDGGEPSVVVSGFSGGALQDPTIRIPVPTSSRSFVHPCPVWSPDGRRIATVAPGRGVLIADLDGDTRLVEIGAAYGLREGGLGLAWSPDGSHVALLVPSSADAAVVWMVPADAGEAHLLTDANGDTFRTTAGELSWTSDGRSVVVAGTSCCSQSEPLFQVVDVATGERFDVPLPDAWKDGILQVLPAGDDRFIVMRDWGPDLAWFDLEGNVTPIHLQHLPASFVGLSPDGQQLLFVTFDQPPTSDPDCNGQYLVAVPIAGGEATRYSPCSNPGFGDNYSVFSWQPIPRG